MVGAWIGWIDEITITGTTEVAVLDGDKITGMTVHPEDAGLPVHPLAAILGGTPEVNTKALMALMNGEKGAYRDAVLLNAAAALIIADKVNNLKDGVAMAAASIDSGRALAAIQTLARVTSEAA